MEGIILSSKCGYYEVLANKKVYTCKPRGIFRHKKIKPAVGDFVTICLLYTSPSPRDA